MSRATPPSESLCAVLVVDDDDQAMRDLSAALEASRSCVLSMALSGQMALEYVRATRPMLVLLARRLPDMDGLEVLRLLRAEPELADIPVIMLVPGRAPAEREAAFLAGADEVLEKPLLSVETAARVGARLELALARRGPALPEPGDDAELALSRQEAIHRLARAAELRDSGITGHTRRVRSFTEILARAAGVAPDRTCDMGLAAVMHDVGKIAIPEDILLKPGGLNDAEWDLVRTHTTVGERVLWGASSRLMRLAAAIAGGHHENWDGGGYPRGLAGNDIPLPARIVRVCDVFDALIMDRPYRPGMEVSQALTVIHQGRGTHFEPRLAALFLEQEAALRQAVAAARHEDRAP